MNRIVRESLLFDFYGELLTAKKRKVMSLYHEENWSLAEIAEELGISRAAVYDSLKSAEKRLEEYEEKLGMLAQMSQRISACEKARLIVADMDKKCGDADLRIKLREITEILNELEK